MINIQRFFENHLANPEISAEELRQFAEDHIGKLKALPSLPANLAALVAPTEAAFDEFDGKLSARAILQATQSGGTITKDEALQLFRTTSANPSARRIISTNPSSKTPRAAAGMTRCPSLWLDPKHARVRAIRV